MEALLECTACGWIGTEGEKEFYVYQWACGAESVPEYRCPACQSLNFKSTGYFEATISR